MSFSATGLSLEEKGVVHFGWDELKAELSRSDAAAQVYVVDTLELLGLQGEVTKLPGGVSRSFGLTKQPVTAEPKVEAPVGKHHRVPPEPPPLPTVELKRFAVVASKLAFRDRSAKGVAEPPPYDVTDFRLEAAHPFVLQGDDPTTAVLDLALTTSVEGVLGRGKVTLHAIPYDAEPTFRVELDLAGINGPEIHKRSPGLSEKYDLSHWTDAMAHAVANFTIKSHGRIDTLATSPAPLAFELDMDSIEVRSTPSAPLVFGLDDLRLDVTSYDLKTGGLHAKKLELANPTVVMAKEPAGFRALDVLFKNPPPPQPGAEVKPEEPAPASSSPGMQIDKLTMGDGEIVYDDTTVTPAVDFHMGAWEIELLGYTSNWKTQKKPMGIAIRSRSGTYDDFKIKGQLALAPKLEGDLTIRCLQLQLDKINGWCALGGKGVEWKAPSKLDLEGRWSFHNSHIRGLPTVVLQEPDVVDLGDWGIKTAVSLLRNSDGNVELKDVLMEFELDDDLKFKKDQNANFSLGSIVGQALKGALGGAVANLVPGFKPEPPKKGEEKDKWASVSFAPVEARLPAESIPELDKLVAKLKENEHYFVNLRGEVGRDDDVRARQVASPALEDRRDLIARLESDRATLERRRADAGSEVRAALQSGIGDVGVGRAHLTDISVELAKVDKALENLYEQEREGAERGADRRARDFENELCDSRVEAIAAYLIQRGAPTEHIKRIAAKLKPIESDVGKVAVTSFVARRTSADRSAVEQKPGAAK